MLLLRTPEDMQDQIGLALQKVTLPTNTQLHSNFSDIIMYRIIVLIRHWI